MYCVWLTFDSSNLSEIIIKLARKYNGPVFQPHCTLVGKIDVSLPRIKSAIINHINKYKIIKVHPKKFGYSDYFWRTLYIELEEKPALTILHRRLCDSLSINYDKNFLPHISLMYSSLSLREKKRISANVKLKSVYNIKSIQIIDCGENIDDWRTVFELKI